MEKEIIKILEQNAQEGWNGDVEAVGYVDFESVAEQLVKLFATIPDVVCGKCKSNDYTELQSPIYVCNNCDNKI